MRLRLRRRALRRLATFELLEARCVLSGLSLEVGAVQSLPNLAVEQQASEVAVERFGPELDLTRVRDLYGFTGQGQTIAVIDTGIAYDQRALGNGFGKQARVVGGWDFAENDADPYDDGPAGFHGTHVAGIIASSDVRYEGVAPGVDLVALRVFDDVGNGNLQWVEQALRWVDQQRDAFRYPITTINLSLGTAWNSDRPPQWSSLEDEFQSLWQHGVLVVAAAGNSYSQYGSPGLSYPAASPYALAVGSLNENGNLSAFSQRHASMIAAPGENIISTVPDHLLSRDGRNDDWAAASGTSMASPVVAGSAALLREAMTVFETAVPTPSAVIDLLHETSTTVWDSSTGQTYDAINLIAALEQLTPPDDYGDTPAEAHSLGTLRSGDVIAGTISTRQDQDAFQFQVPHAGWLTWDTTAPDSSQVDPAWEVIGASKRLEDGQWQYFVQPGVDYVLSLESTGGVGRYEARARLASSEISWGSVVDGVYQATASATRYAFRAAQDGLVTVVDTSNIAQWRLQDSHGEWHVPRRNRAGDWQVDVWSRAGDEFIVEYAGANEASLHVMNRVHLRHGILSVSDVDGASRISIGLGTKVHLSIDGVRYAWRSESIGRIRVAGDDRDSLVVYGTRQSEDVAWDDSSLTWKSPAATVHAVGFGEMQLHGGGGIDDVFRVFGSDGPEQWMASGQDSDLDSGKRQVSARGFDRMYFDGRGGVDTVVLEGTSGNDEFIGRGDELRLVGDGYYLRAIGAEDVSISGGGGIDDVARLNGSAVADRWFATVGQGRWLAGDSVRTISDFDRVYVREFDGPEDQVVLRGDEGRDRFDVRRDEIIHRADRWFQRIEGWTDLWLDGGGGADDIAYLSGLDPADRLRELSDQLAGWIRGDQSLTLESLDAIFASLDHDA